MYKIPHLERVSLRSGRSGPSLPIEFDAATINVFIGPNHSGKSLFLRELQEAVKRDEPLSSWKVLRKIEFERISEDGRSRLVQFLRDVAFETSPGVKTLRTESNSWTLRSPQFEEHLLRSLNVERFSDFPSPFAHFLRENCVLMLNGKKRLSMLDPCRRGNLLEPSNHLLGKLFQNDDRRREVQKIIRDAFGCTLVVNPFPEENLEAKMAECELPLGVEQSLSREAAEFFRGCKDMSQMSDGVRAYSGMVAAIICSDHGLILIDEPEAFLHPQLCSKLAGELCRQARVNGKQLFVSTHSAAFLMGCVQSGIDVNVIRLTYHRGTATSRILRKDELMPLMRQPLLRSVGALSGIFCESVVVTESASDRAFYDEINYRCVNSESGLGIPECLFLNAQNWQTVGRIIGPLRKLGVAASAIVDLDIVRDNSSAAFQSLMEAAGAPLGVRQSLGQLRGVLHRRIKDSCVDIKRTGVEGFSGDERKELESFVDQISAYGVFLVPVGELERWLPNLNRGPFSEKNSWLLATFEGMGDDSSSPGYLLPTTGDVWGFVEKVGSWLRSRNRLGMPD